MKILINGLFFSMIMFHKFDEDGYPLIFDVVVITGELPDRFIAILIVLGYKGVAFAGEGLANIFTFHEMAAVKVDL